MIGNTQMSRSNADSFCVGALSTTAQVTTVAVSYSCSAQWYSFSYSDFQCFDYDYEHTLILGFVGKLHRRPESARFFRLAKTAKQAMVVLSSIQPDAARRKKSRSKPDRGIRHSLAVGDAAVSCITVRTAEYPTRNRRTSKGSECAEVPSSLDIPCWIFCGSFLFE